MAHVTCRLTAKDEDRLRKPPLGNRVWATFTCCPHTRLFRVCCPLHGRLTTRRQDPNAGNSRFAEFRSKKYQNTISGTSSAASAVRRLPSAVRTATPAFHVRSSGLFCSRPGGLQLITRLPARSVTRSFDSFRHDLKTFLVLHSALEAMRLYST